MDPGGGVGWAESRGQTWKTAELGETMEKEDWTPAAESAAEAALQLVGGGGRGLDLAGVLLGRPLAAGVAAHEGVHAHACGSLVVCGARRRRRQWGGGGLGGWWGENPSRVAGLCSGLVGPCWSGKSSSGSVAAWVGRNED